MLIEHAATPQGHLGLTPITAEASGYNLQLQGKHPTVSTPNHTIADLATRCTADPRSISTGARLITGGTTGMRCSAHVGGFGVTRPTG